MTAQPIKGYTGEYPTRPAGSPKPPETVETVGDRTGNYAEAYYGQFQERPIEMDHEENNGLPNMAVPTINQAGARLNPY